jgi:alpha-beta hydrolase superfamily lysophospholipase
MVDPTGADPVAEPREAIVTDPQGVDVHVYVWDHEEPRAVVHVSHGVGEHAGRYAHVARALHAAGYAVVADDHRGHGATGVGHLGLGELGKGAHHAVFDAVEAVAQQARSWFAPAPFVMLGHSWGSLVAQKLLARTPELFDGLVLSGTSYALPGVINGGDLGKRFRVAGGTGFEWLSRDPAVGAAFAADPLTFDVNARSPYTWWQALQLLGRPPRHLRRDVPVLIQGGAEDTLGGTRGMAMLAEAYRRRSGLTDVSLMVYPGARHEIYNETNKDEVLVDLVAWLDARFGPRP